MERICQPHETTILIVVPVVDLEFVLFHYATNNCVSVYSFQCENCLNNVFLTRH